MDHPSRRDFLKAAAAVAAAPYLPSLDPLLKGRAAARVASVGDPFFRELTAVALDAARRAGATYADVRISTRRSQYLGTREQQVQDVGSTESIGFGVRAIAKGAWGFSASNVLTKDEAARIARAAVAQAKANSAAIAVPIVLAPVTPTPNGEWKSPIAVDPFAVPLADKVALLLDANAAALKVKNARFVSSSLFFDREEKTLATSDGTFVVQTIYQSNVDLAVTAISADGADFQARSSTELAPAGLGYEYVTGAKLSERASVWAEEAVQKLSAKPVEPGRYDLVLHPTNLWLTIHESVGHPTELDRAEGEEADLAGTSFLAPPRQVLGTLKFGSELMNVRGDRSQVGSLSAVGWDDDGVQPEDFMLIERGVFVDYQTTREQAPWLEWWYTSRGKPVRSHGCCYADSWRSVQFQRMPNVSLLPGEKDYVWEDLISATDRGIAIVGESSYSIDQQRYNAQFSGQMCYEIKGGKIVGQLKDVAYQIRTPEFWGSMDMIGGKRSYWVGGSRSDGKGQPMQVNGMSHGCVPTRHRQVNVINTGRKA